MLCWWFFGLKNHPFGVGKASWHVAFPAALGARIVMTAIFALLVVSAVLGLISGLGLRFAWTAFLVSGFVLVLVSVAILQRAGFDFLEGITIIVICLTLNQVACLIGVRLQTN